MVLVGIVGSLSQSLDISESTHTHIFRIPLRRYEFAIPSNRPQAFWVCQNKLQPVRIEFGGFNNMIEESPNIIDLLDIAMPVEHRLLRTALAGSASFARDQAATENLAADDFPWHLIERHKNAWNLLIGCENVQLRLENVVECLKVDWRLLQLHPV